MMVIKIRDALILCRLWFKNGTHVYKDIRTEL